MEELYCPHNIDLLHTILPLKALQKGSNMQTVKSGITKTAGDNVETKLQRFLFDYRRTPQTTTGKSPMEVLNQRKRRSRLDLLHPSLQGKVHKKQTQMKDTHDRKGHERKFTPEESVYMSRTLGQD